MGIDFMKDSIILAAPQINQDAVRLMKELYGIDMEKKQYSKLISSIPEPDISISMGFLNIICIRYNKTVEDTVILISLLLLKKQNKNVTLGE